MEQVKGLEVKGRIPGSLSEKAGVRRGDTIFSVNGERVLTMDDYIKARGLNKDKMDVVLIRTGQMIELTMNFNEVQV